MNDILKNLYANSLRIILKGLRTGDVEELARIGGIEPAIAAELAEKLGAAGEFIPEPTAGAKGYSFNPRYKLALAICAPGKDRAIAAVSDLYGNCIEKAEIAGNTGSLDFYDHITASYRDKYPALAGLALGLPGLDESSGIPFREHFKTKYGLPGVFENEVRPGVLGFYEKRRFGEGKCVIALYVPDSAGPSAGICIDGKLYRGRDNAAGKVTFLKTSERWRPDSELSLPVIADIALSLSVCFNPDGVVIYSPWMPPDASRQIRELLLEAVPQEFLPSLEYAPDITPDALDGLIQLALQELDNPPMIDLLT
ncbi:MAG: hypothetical protein LBG90_04370 [Spirochaetaceae bacterium]|nr:hypothetical protein [Spirochaetaceae bacterium]